MIHSVRSPSSGGKAHLLVIEQIEVCLARGIELPRLPSPHRIQRQLHVVGELVGALGAAGLVVDQLVLAAGQPVDAVDAAAKHVRPELERELALEPHRLGVVGLEALVVAGERCGRLSAQLALLLGIAEAAPPPAGIEQSEQLRQSARWVGGISVRVVALEDLVDEDPEPLVDRRLLGNAEHSGELVLERTRPVGVDV